MTNQEKKAWLKRYLESAAETSDIELEIERLTARAEKMTSVLKLNPSGGSGNGRSLESAVERIIEAVDKLGKKKIEKLKLRNEIGDAIDELTDDRMRRLLRYRYINGMKWEQIWNAATRTASAWSCAAERAKPAGIILTARLSARPQI